MGGVLYVGPGQENDEKAIFSNQFGSIRYSKFLSGLGSLVDTTTTDPGRVFMGGLDPSKDGQFAYIWQDDAMQMVFHTATLMPNVKGDLQKSLNKKKMHMGNTTAHLLATSRNEDWRGPRVVSDQNVARLT